MPRATMISSVQELTGADEPVDEVVLLQQRPIWSLPAGIVAGAAAYFVLLSVDLGAIVRGAIAGGVLGLVFAATSTRWLLAGTPTRTLLLRSKFWYAAAESIEAEYPRGVVMTAGSSFINATYTLDGRTFVVSRASTSRLATIATLH